MSVKDFFKKMSEPEDIDDRLGQDDLYDPYDDDRRDNRRSDRRNDRYDDDDGYHEAHSTRDRRVSDDDYGDRGDRRRSRTAYDDSYDDVRSDRRESRVASSGDGYDTDYYGSRSGRSRSDDYRRDVDTYEDNGNRRYGSVYEPDDHQDETYDDSDSRDPLSDYVVWDPKKDSKPSTPEPTKEEPVEEIAEVEDAKPLCFLPDSYSNVRKELVNALHDGNPIVVDVSLLPEDELQRLTDFVLGAALALDASLFRLDASSVFVVAPKGTNLDPDEANDAMRAYVANRTNSDGAPEDVSNA